MKKIINFLATAMTLLTLFSLQLCLLKYEHTIQINLLLVAYIYSLFTKLNIIIPATLLMLLDSINFMITGYFGFTTIIMTVFSKLCLKLQHDFYHKLIMPISLITLYCIIQATAIFYFFNKSTDITTLLTGIIFNNTMLITTWIINKEPINE